jgi:hypothetical protein
MYSHDLFISVLPEVEAVAASLGLKELLPVWLDESEEQLIRFGESGLYLTTSDGTAKTFAGNVTVDMWVPGVEHYYPATRESPPDVDVEDGPESRRLDDALKWIAAKATENRIDEFYEQLSDGMHIDGLECGEDLGRGRRCVLERGHTGDHGYDVTRG